ncbi:MAG: electron transfer flavoprotein subunit beta/FixA family protein [bacterium]
MKENKGKGNVTVLSVGPERATEAIREALAMGADEAILIKTEEDYIDSLATAKALVEILKEMEYDLILFGKQAVDDDNLQVGPMVAELLDLPCITFVTELSLQDGKAIAKREIERKTEIVETLLPSIFTTEKGLNKPRYPSLSNIMRAERKTIQRKQISIYRPKTKIINMNYPHSQSVGKIMSECPDAISELVKLLREEAKVI